MSKKLRVRARIPRSEDPLGFGLKSIPEPLQRLWLIRKGNPGFQENANEARTKLAIPDCGFTDASGYTDWVATRMKRHGHDDSLGRLSLVIDGVTFRDGESLMRRRCEGLKWPSGVSGPPPPCCEADPLYEAARELAAQYGIDEAAGEPGFASIENDIAGYLIGSSWPKRYSFRGHETIYEVDIVANPRTGQRFKESYLRQERGIDSRAGEGGMLPIWFEWWKRHRQYKRRMNLSAIEAWSEKKYGQWHDERSIRNGIERVEGLMKPIQA